MSKAKELTVEQKLAIKYEKDLETYKSHCTESSLFTNNLQNYDDLEELIEVEQQIKQLKAKSTELRQKILNNMQSVNCHRAISIMNRKQLNISTGKSSSKRVFNESLFKSDYPDLYKKYSYTQSYGGHSGTLTLRDIGNKAYDFYTKNELLPYLYFPKPIWNKVGEIYSIIEFFFLVQEHTLTEYDGYAVYYDENTQDVTNLSVSLESLMKGDYIKQYHYVVWYNK